MQVNSDFGNKLAQLEQLLRMYRCCKKDFSSDLISDVKQQCNLLVKHLEAYPEMYVQIRKKLSALMEKSFQDQVVPQKVIKKQTVQPSESSISGNSQSNADTPRDTSSRKQIQKQSLGQSQSEKSINQNINKANTVIQGPDVVRLPSDSFGSSFSSNSAMKGVTGQSQSEISQESNLQVNFYALSNFVSKHLGTIEQNIIINQDLMSDVKNDAKTTSEQAFLAGIHRFGSEKSPHLLLCTKMKFSTAEIINKQSGFQKQLNQFQNSVRVPFALFVKGQDIKAIKPHYIYFLGLMKAPFPFIFVMKDIANLKGFMVKYNSQVVQKVEDIPFDMLGTSDLEQYIHDPANFKCIDMENMNISKERLVVSKTLMKAVHTDLTQSAPHAIEVIDCSKWDIKQQVHVFKYKTHSKYLTTPKGNFEVYIVDKNDVLAGKKKFQDFEIFNKEVRCEENQNFVLAIGVTKAEIEIRKDFLTLIVQVCKDPVALINVVTMKQKKTLIFKIRSGVTKQTIQASKPLTYQQVESDNFNQVTMKIDLITKKNFKNFECDGKVDLIELGKKK